MKPSRPTSKIRCRFHAHSLFGLAAIILPLAMLAPPILAADDLARLDSVEIGVVHQFETDLDDDGDFEMTGGYARIQLAIPITDHVRVRTIASYHGAKYGFDDPPTIAGAEFAPWNMIHVARFNPQVEVQVSDRWRVFGGPLFEVSLENGADVGSGFKPGGLLGAEVTLSPTLTFGFGLLGGVELEDDPYFQPLVTLDWKPRDQITVLIESRTTRGAKIEVAYQPFDQFEVAYSIRYRRERFRLKEHVIAPGPPAVFRSGSKGIGEDRAVVTAFRISYLPDATAIQDLLGSIRMDVEVGVAFAGDLRIENEFGNLTQTTRYRPAPSLTFKLTVPL